MMSSFFTSVTVPIVLVGNKLDTASLRGHINPADHIMLVSRAKGIAMAQKIGAYVFMECSAEENDGVRDVFGMAFKAITGIKQKSPMQYEVRSKVI